jgi:nucleoside-diphosphate-sugar epimerase
MKLLVTGANGFLGRPMCLHLGLLGHDVVPTVRRPSGLSNEHVVGDEASWRAALVGCDSVIHLAARAHVMNDHETDSLKVFRANNVDVTIELATRAIEAGVRRFVFMSTAKVNGEETAIGCSFKPDDPPDPKDPYAISKSEAEQGLLKIAQRTGLEVVIIRPPLVYGPKVKGNFASLIALVRKGMPLPLGAINNRRSMIALDNLVNFTAVSADINNSPNAKNQVFLVSDGEDVSTSSLLRKIAEAYGYDSHLFSLPAGLIRLGAKLIGKSAMSNRLLGSLEIDSSKARQMLGWHPVVSMDDQLKKMALHDSII